MCLQILLHELGSLKVEIMHRGAERRKFRVIGISRLPASQLTFPDQESGTQVTVADYFKEEYQVILPPAPGVSNEGRSSPLLVLVPPFLGPGFRLGARWNRLGQAVKTRKRREKTGGNGRDMA